MVVKANIVVAALVILLTLAGCRSRQEATPPAPKGAIAASKELATRLAPAHVSARVAPLVAELRTLDSVSGRSIGIDGSPGPFFLLSLQFLDLAEDGDFERLVSDPQPIVRAMGLVGSRGGPPAMRTR